MAKKRDLLTQMRDNPRNDWKIEDFQKACKKIGLHIEPPNGGSHYKVSSKYLNGHLTVPARRPIKPVYIHEFIGLCQAHIKVEKQRKGEK